MKLKVKNSVLVYAKKCSKKPCIILFAESHGFLNDWKLQKDIIKLSKSKTYIWEMLEDKKLEKLSEFNKFINKKDTENFSIISKYCELKGIVKWCKENKIKITGCDLKNMGRKDKNFLSKKELTKSDIRKEENLIKKREKHQAKIIKETYKKDKQTIFCSVGAYHLRPNSYLLNNLKDVKNLILILPFHNSKQIFGPINENKKSSNKFIEYKIIKNF